MCKFYARLVKSEQGIVIHKFDSRKVHQGTLLLLGLHMLYVIFVVRFHMVALLLLKLNKLVGKFLPQLWQIVTDLEKGKDYFF